jgi:hypothetical protein
MGKATTRVKFIRFIGIASVNNLNQVVHPGPEFFN